jgi:siroheme synthase-like protein
VNLNLSGRLCLVAGGGRVALRKVRGLLAAGAKVRVAAPQAVAELAALVEDQTEERQLEWRRRPYAAEDLDGVLLVFAATGVPAVDRQVLLDAQARGLLVNMAAAPEFGDFAVPASIRHDDFLMTVSTGGASPELARQLRRELEESYGESWGELAARLARLRSEVRARVGSHEMRQRFWRQALDEKVLSLAHRGCLDEAERKIRDELSRFGTES